MNKVRVTGALLAAASLAAPGTASAGGLKAYAYKVVAASGSSVWHGIGSNGTGDATLSWKLAKPKAGAPNNAHLQQMMPSTWIGDVGFNYYGTLAASDQVNFGKACSTTIHSGQDPFNGAEPPLGQLALVNKGRSIQATWTFLPLADLVFDDPDGTCSGISGGPSWPDSNDPARTTTLSLSKFTGKRLTLTTSGSVAHEGSLTWKASVTLQRVLPKKKKRHR